MIELVINSILIVFAYANFWFIVSLYIKRNDFIDVAWGAGYVLLCAYYFFAGVPSPRAFLIYGLVFLWGTRLTVYLFLRNKNKTEDFRYLNWRKQWGKYFYIRSYFQVYLLQGFLLMIIITPVPIVAANPGGGLFILDYAGILLWVIGFYFQALGDHQLARFKKDAGNKGKIIETGLWRYTRHPNYFGEVMMWWGIFLIALGSPGAFYGFIGPLTITLLILFVSGIPMLEEKYEGNAAYEDYKSRTGKFWPRPPTR